MKKQVGKTTHNIGDRHLQQFVRTPLVLNDDTIIPPFSPLQLYWKQILGRDNFPSEPHRCDIAGQALWWYRRAA